MDNSSNMKNYVSLLNEILSKKKMIPDYKVVENGTGSSSTKFKVQMDIEGKTAVGVGRSKKEAKHECARNMYEIFEKQSLLPPPKPSLLEDNSVGYVYQFCQLSGWGVPKFELVSEHGPPHEKIFTVSCKLNEFTTEGHGCNLKQARQSAARLMVPYLKSYDLNNFKEENQVVAIALETYKLSKLLNSQISQEEKNGSDPSQPENNKRSIDVVEDASKLKKIKTYKSSKEDVDFSMELISKFKCLSLEKKEELKTQIRNLVDTFMEEFNKCFTCSRVIQVLKDKNRITDEKTPRVNPSNLLFKYFKQEPFVTKSQMLKTYKEIDVQNIQDPEGLFKTVTDEYDITYSFKEAKSAVDKRIMFLNMKTDQQKWTVMGIGNKDAEIIAIRQALKFLIEMSQ